MKRINELYHFNNKWYDYPVAQDAKHEIYKINSPKPFRVYHSNGTFDLAYSYGEYQFTFDIIELKSKRAQYQYERHLISERNTLIKKLQQLDTNTLRELVNSIE